MKHITESLKAGASVRVIAKTFGVSPTTVQTHRKILNEHQHIATTSIQGGFSAILADPAWSFDNYAPHHIARTPQSHYSVMTVEDICSLPVKEVAADDCMLFLWAVSPRLPDAIKVGEAWGFTFKTVAFTWVKQLAKGTRYHAMPIAHPMHWHMGMGYYTRANPELCLLFTRGNPKRLSKSVRELVVSPIREHSRKPDEIYSRIEMLTEGKYLELFARHTRRGWTALGNEIDGRCLTKSLINLAEICHPKTAASPCG